MICINCGEKIRYGIKKCPHCGQDTEYETRFHYIPSPAPISVPISVDPVETENPGNNNDNQPDVPTKEPCEKVRSLFQHVFNRVTGIKRTYTIRILTGVILLLFVLLFGLSAIHRLKGEPSIGKTTQSDTDSLISEETKMPDEEESQLSESSEQASSELKGYRLHYDLNLPEGVSDVELTELKDVNFQPGMTAPTPDVTVEGILFVGWGTTPEEPGCIIPAGEKIPLLTEDTVLYAIWRIIENDELSKYIEV